MWDFCRGSKELMTVPLPIDINHNERVDVLDIQPWNLLQVFGRISEHVCQDDLANKVCMNRKRAFSNISCQVSNCVKWKRRDNYGRLININEVKNLFCGGQCINKCSGNEFGKSGTEFTDNTKLLRLESKDKSCKVLQKDIMRLNDWAIK